MKTTVKKLRNIVKEEVKSVANRDKHSHLSSNEIIMEKVIRRLMKIHEETVEGTPSAPMQPDYAKKVASKLAAAAEGGIGLLTQAYGSQGVQIVLYKTNVFIGNILANLDPETKKLENSEDVATAADKSVVGMLVLDGPEDACNDALSVKYVVSREGYGPMLYEVGMQLSPSGRIMSDRKAVSDAATNIYKVFHSRADIEKKPLDDNNIPMHKRKTPDDPSDDCEVWNHRGKNPGREFLDFSFSGSNINIASLKKNHQEAMAILKRHVDANKWADYLADVSNMIFMSIYHQTPMSARGLK